MRFKLPTSQETGLLLTLDGLLRSLTSGCAVEKISVEELDNCWLSWIGSVSSPSNVGLLIRKEAGRVGGFAIFLCELGDTLKLFARGGPGIACLSASVVGRLGTVIQEDKHRDEFQSFRRTSNARTPVVRSVMLFQTSDQCSHTTATRGFITARQVALHKRCS